MTFDDEFKEPKTFTDRQFAILQEMNVSFQRMASHQSILLTNFNAAREEKNTIEQETLAKLEGMYRAQEKIFAWFSECALVVKNFENSLSVEKFFSNTEAMTAQIKRTSQEIVCFFEQARQLSKELFEINSMLSQVKAQLDNIEKHSFKFSIDLNLKDSKTALSCDQDILDKKIADLDCSISSRLISVLHKNYLVTIGQIKRYGVKRIKKLRNMGTKTFKELKRIFENIGVELDP